MQREPRRHVKTVLLTLLHVKQIIVTALDDDVACRAGAISPARMFKMYAEVQSDVEYRL